MDRRGGAQARIDFRPTADQKRLFEQAAAVQGRSLTDFLISSAEESAHRTLDEHERIVLDDKARVSFLIALTEPPMPNAKLLALAKRYNRDVKQ